jgi:hypothetical protein
MSSQNPYAPPQANLQGPAVTGSGVNISTLPVSDKWKARFYVIQKAGCPEKSSMNGFNVLAFFFGPLFYLAKGMPKRGATLFVLTTLVVIVASIFFAAIGFGVVGKVLSIGVSAIYASRANVDFYRKMVLNDNGWW